MPSRKAFIFDKWIIIVSTRKSNHRICYLFCVVFDIVLDYLLDKRCLFAYADANRHVYTWWSNQTLFAKDVVQCAIQCAQFNRIFFFPPKYSYIHFVAALQSLTNIWLVRLQSRTFWASSVGQFLIIRPSAVYVVRRRPCVHFFPFAWVFVIRPFGECLSNGRTDKK